MRIVLLFMILIATTTATQPADPKQVALAFETAVNAGDADGVRDNCTGTAEQIAAAVAVAQGSIAEHRLSDAARDKFGDESAKLLAHADYKPFDFPFDDPALTVTTDGDLARIIVPTRVRPLMTLIRSGDRWRVDAGSILFLSRTPAALAAMEERSTKIKIELSAEIAAGQYPTAEDAARAKAQKILDAEGRPH